jgi:hypothetical protein
MENFIGDIFYFGSPKDGFKVYPDLGAISNIFAGYYTNTESDWILVAKKSNDITTYTYVRYGLLTSAVNGRTGSCLGISIDFINYYFTDFELLRTRVIEKIWEAFLVENVLLERQEISRKIAFKPYSLNEVGQYLDAKSQTIRRVITEHYSKNVKTSNYIPDAEGNPLYELNPRSSAEVITDLFETYGLIKLSPRAPIETKSISQKTEEQIEALQRKVKMLSYQLGDKDSEIESLQDELDSLREGLPLTNQLTGPNNEQGNNREAKATTRAKKSTSLASLLRILRKPSVRWAFAVVICMSGVGGFILGRLFPSSSIEKQTDTHDQSESVNPSKAQTISPFYTQHDPRIREERGNVIREAGGRGFLVADTFVRMNQGKSVAGREGFKILLTSYLISNSLKTVRIYGGDKNNLWDNIMKLNPGKEQEIAGFCKSNPQFTIEVKNKFQKRILDNLLIYSE